MLVNIIHVYCSTLLTFKQDENLHQNVTTNGGVSVQIQKLICLLGCYCFECMLDVVSIRPRSDILLRHYTCNWLLPYVRYIFHSNVVSIY